MDLCCDGLACTFCPIIYCVCVCVCVCVCLCVCLCLCVCVRVWIQLYHFVVCVNNHLISAIM